MFKRERTNLSHSPTTADVTGQMVITYRVVVAAAQRLLCIVLCVSTCKNTLKYLLTSPTAVFREQGYFRINLFLKYKRPVSLF